MHRKNSVDIFQDTQIKERQLGDILSTEAIVTNIQLYCIHDGPGIRTVVFFKGCGFACQWCSNPESISPKPEVGFIKTLCTRCGKCAGVCPEGALCFDVDEVPRLDYQRCTGCGECVSVCTYNALVLYGKQMSVQEVFDAVSRDSMFYQASGGGVTVSGGEPLLHPQFVHTLFDKCHKTGIHTCVETAGYAPASAFKQVLTSTDYVLFDLKHLNSSKHRQFVGKPNRLVLENAKLVVESGVEILFRMPLIPGINDDLQNIRETAAFLKGLSNNLHRIELLPYHRMGENKYKYLGRAYLMHDLMPPEPEHVESIKQAFGEYGILCLVST